jgi:hypothetical protein
MAAIPINSQINFVEKVPSMEMVPNLLVLSSIVAPSIPFNKTFGSC